MERRESVSYPGSNPGPSAFMHQRRSAGLDRETVDFEAHVQFMALVMEEWPSGKAPGLNPEVVSKMAQEFDSLLLFWLETDRMVLCPIRNRRPS